MTKKRKIILSVAGVLVLLLVLLVGKLGIVQVPGVKSAFQSPGTCNNCHEVWYDEASYAFNPKGNKSAPKGVTVGCAECHPVQYEEYRLSAMGNSKNPLRPGCTNCHDNVHSSHDWFDYMYLAPKAWINGVQIGLRDRDTYNKTLSPSLANKARALFLANDSARCRECHTDPSHQAELKGTLGEFRPEIAPHQQMVKDKMTCVQCHQNLMHNLSFPAPWNGTPTAAEKGDFKKGAEKAQACAGCHGADGNSASADYPSIAQLNANYIFTQLEDFKNGSRNNPMMAGMAGTLSVEDMADLSKFYSQQQMHSTVILPNVLQLRARSDLEMGETLYRGNCARCHGLSGRGQGVFPRLAGQRPEYTEAQIQAFRDKSRTPHSIMRDLATGLKDPDMKLISNYLGSLE